MKNSGAIFFGLLCSVFLVACNFRTIDDFGLEKLIRGISSETDVRNAMGSPTMVWNEADGSQTLEYPKGPEGHRTFMVSVDQQGLFQAYAQVLTPENFGRIQAGMSRDEVRRILGKPRTVVPFVLKNEEVWDWQYQERAALRFFNVHFDRNSGQVIRTSRSDPIEG